jgi:hypothetical protein
MYGPTLDHDFITDYTYPAFTSGKFVHVPAIYGDDTNEVGKVYIDQRTSLTSQGTVFTPQNTSSIGESDTFIRDQFPALTLAQLARINEYYPVEGTPTFPNSGRYWRQVSNAYGEIRYICPGIYISRIYAKEKVPVYNYRWNVEDPDQIAQGLGVPHTIEGKPACS